MSQIQIFKPKLPPIANVTLPVARFIHTLGEWMINDDRDDLFKTVYYNDQYHYYHGEKHPDHPGFLHHWMWGGMLVMTGQMLGAMSMAREVMYNNQNSPPIDIDNIPLPGGRLLPPRTDKVIIPIPYQEVRPAIQANIQYQRLKSKIDSIAKL